MTDLIDRLARTAGKPSQGSGAKVAAEKIGCDPNLVQAFFNVESVHGPFDRSGRLIILPEKHVFWRQLPAGARGLAERRGLAHRGWRPKSQYKGLGGSGSDARWRRLADMSEVDETAALMSCSIGGPQIMGFNYRVCGFSSVETFWEQLAETEDAQIIAFVNFIKGNRLDDEMRAFDIRAVVRGYNGSGQVEKYTGRIMSEYRKLSKGDMPAVSEPVRRGGLRIGSTGYRVKALQERLRELGYMVAVDGDFGPATRKEVLAFQAAQGIETDGVVGPATQGALDDAAPIEIPDREALTVSDLKGKSRVVDATSNIKKAAGGAGGIAALVGGIGGEDGPVEALAGLTEKAEGLSGIVQSAREFGAIFVEYWYIALALGAFVFWWQANKAQKARLEDQQSGKTT